MLDVLTNPQMWLLVLVLSILGSFARLANYYAGQRGKDTIESIYPRIKPETWDRVLLSYKRLSYLPLLLASIPIVGTLLTVGAGMAGVGRTGLSLGDN
jgi:membrane protein YqaA with SNARE-associated domain